MFYFFKKNFILFLALILLLIIVFIFFISKSEELSHTTQQHPQGKVIKEKKIIAPVKPAVTQAIKQKVELKKLTPVKTPIVTKKLDFLNNEKPFVYSKPKLEIDQILKNQKKIDNFAEKKYSIPKKEDWEIDYKIGLEEDAAKRLHDGESLNPDMVNGKIKFSKSF